MLRRTLALTILASGLLCSQFLHGQEVQDDEEESRPSSPTASLTIIFDQTGTAKVTLYSGKELSQTAAIRAFLIEKWGCQLAGSSIPSRYADRLSAQQKQAYAKMLLESQMRGMSGSCAGLMHKNGLKLDGIIELQPLLQILKNDGLGKLNIAIEEPLTPMLIVNGPFQASSTARAGFWNMEAPTDAPASTLKVTYGYRASDIAWIALWTGLYIFTPIVVVLIMRSTALRRGKDDPAAGWFSYMRTFQLCVNATFLFWCATRLNTREPLGTLLEFLGWNSGWRQVLVSVLAVMAPAWIVYVICTALSFKVFIRIRNVQVTRSEFLKEQFARLGKAFFPISFVMAAALTFTKSPKQSLVLLLLAYLSSVICGSLAQKFARSHPVAITAGPLRDHIFSMAQKIGVKLQHVFVVAATKTSTANAFATTKQTIIFTDYLLNKLTQREVDAVAAHELTHLRHNHAQKSAMFLWLTILSPTFFSFAVSMVSGFFFIPLLLLGKAPAAHILTTVLASAWINAAVLLGAFWLFYYVRRRFEYTADAGAAYVTGDPEAAITGLLKISRLGLIPIQWGRGSEATLTHPSTLRRVQRIAAAHGINNAQLQDIIRSVDTASISSDQVQTHGYAVGPNTPGVVPIGKMASWLRFRRWTLIAFHFLPASAIVLALQHIPRLQHWQGSVMLSGVIFSVAVYHFVIRWMNCNSRRHYGAIARKNTQEKLGESLSVEGVPVGFAPGPSPRFFLASYNWDHGMLFLSDENIAFVGGHTSFGLRRDQIRTIMPGHGGPSWMKSSRLYFSWEDKKTGKFGTFSFAPLDQKNLFSHPAEARNLYQRLRGWRNRIAAVSQTTVGSELGPPEVGIVTGRAPKDINKFSRWLNVTTLVLVLSWAFSVLLGVGYGGYICFTALILRLYEPLPYWFYRERAYVFDPIRPEKQRAASQPGTAAEEPLLTAR